MIINKITPSIGRSTLSVEKFGHYNQNLIKVPKVLETKYNIISIIQSRMMSVRPLRSQ